MGSGPGMVLYQLNSGRQWSRYSKGPPWHHTAVTLSLQEPITKKITSQNHKDHRTKLSSTSSSGFLSTLKARIFLLDDLREFFFRFRVGGRKKIK